MILRILRQQVDEWKAIAALWPEITQHAADCTATFRLLERKVTNGQQGQMTAVKAQLITLWTDLWAVNDSAKLNAIVNTDLPAVRNGLAQLTDLLGVKPTVVSAGTITGTILATPSTTPTSVLGWFRPMADLDLPANDQRRAELLRRAITRGDLQTTMFAGTIALLTGLNTYYLGKPFGTLQDYIGLFLWAAGIKAGLDILTAVWDKFVSR